MCIREQDAVFKYLVNQSTTTYINITILNLPLLGFIKLKVDMKVVQKVHTYL